MGIDWCCATGCIRDRTCQHQSKGRGLEGVVVERRGRGSREGKNWGVGAGRGLWLVGGGRKW